MEVILELLFELFGEYLLAFLVEVFGSLFSAWRSGSAARAGGNAPTPASSAAARPDHAAATATPPLRMGWPVRLVAGAVLGAVSLYFFPHSFAKTLDTQLAVLIGVPILCGLSMGAIGALKRKRHQEAAAIDSFRNGFLFALPFVTVRFFFTA